MKKGTLSWIIAFTVVFALFPVFFKNQYYIQFVINLLMYAYLATSWNILGGYSGQVAMGNGVFLGIGAYVGAVLYIYEGISPFIGMLIAAAIAAIVAYVFGRLTFNLSGTYFSLSTVALLHIVRMWLYSTKTVFGYNTKGAVGLNIKWEGANFWGMQFDQKEPLLYIILIMLVLAIFISYKIKVSKTGYYLAAVRTNQEAAASLGVNVMNTKLKVNCISAAMLAMGGVFFVFMQAVVDPARVLGYDLSAQIMLYCIIGGLGTLWGPVLGAFLLSPLSDFLRASLGAAYAGLALVVYGLLLMLIILFVPGGILSGVTKGYNWLLARYGKKKPLEEVE